MHSRAPNAEFRANDGHSGTFGDRESGSGLSGQAKLIGMVRRLFEVCGYKWCNSRRTTSSDGNSWYWTAYGDGGGSLRRQRLQVPESALVPNSLAFQRKVSVGTGNMTFIFITSRPDSDRGGLFEVFRRGCPEQGFRLSGVARFETGSHPGQPGWPSLEWGLIDVSRSRRLLRVASTGSRLSCATLRRPVSSRFASSRCACPLLPRFRM